MKRIIAIGYAVALVFITVQCGPSKEVRELMDKAKKTFGQIPDKMPGSENDTPELISLGKKLYFEKKLSKNDSQSCNSCHVIDNNGNGVDNLKTSPGAFGKLGGRNSPTVFNAGFHFVQFWDGRAKDLVEQAKGPILNPVEMAMPSEAEVVKKIKGISEYPPLFAKAFPKDKDPLTYQNIAEAIAAFERTLITKDRFDKFIGGDAKALTKEEIAGLKTFMQTGCTSCHSGNLLGAKMYFKMGVTKAYENISDFGRYDITRQDSDRYVFKVPSLRNVANTAPYFHDGGAPTLEIAVSKMAELQLGRKLSDNEVGSIVTFLKSLSKL